jgi:hypothetical protein
MLLSAICPRAGASQNIINPIKISLLHLSPVFPVEPLSAIQIQLDE